VKKQKFIDKCIKDKEGNIVFGQKPNLPIIVWLICLILQQFLEGDLYKLINVIGFGAIFTWAWLEIFLGVNYFRRAIGVLVMVVILISRVY
jgi:hypothetical protein